MQIFVGGELQGLALQIIQLGHLHPPTAGCSNGCSELPLSLWVGLLAIGLPVG